MKQKYPEGYFCDITLNLPKRRPLKVFYSFAMAVAAQELIQPGRIRFEWQLSDSRIALGTRPVALMRRSLWPVTAVSVKTH